MDSNSVAVIRAIILLPLLGFWAWMFWDMTRNEDISDEARTPWAIAFVIFNIFTAIYYYVNIYQKKRAN